MRTFIKTCPNKSLLAALILILILVPFVNSVFAGDNDVGKQKVVRQVAKNYLQIGTEQYRRGQYIAAEKTFLMAQDYYDYLTTAEREQLSDMLSKSHTAAIERQRIHGDVRRARELFAQNKLVEAKDILENVKDSEFLTREDADLISKSLRKIDRDINLLKQDVAESYNRSVDLYNKGHLEKARQGFAGIAGNELLTAPKGMSAKDYIEKIDAALAKKAELQIESKPVEAITEDATKAIVEELIEIAAAPEPDKQIIDTEKPLTVVVKRSEDISDGGYIEEINRKRNILRSHTKAVVNDAIEKANQYISNEEFDKAEQEVETAERVVNRNQLYLGDAIFKQYGAALQLLTEQITTGSTAKTQQMEEQKRLQAMEAQHQYREQMEVDRAKRIAELTENARAYQKQQRYEEALGQLESLLAIDPLNNNALILKQTLEDTIGYRQQLEIRRETSEQRVDLLLKTEQSGVPFAEELTYPKNWREIVAERKPDETIGEFPANVEVYKQLEETIDVSELDSEMSFSEALEILKNATDPPLQISVRWRDLYENADIDKSTPINMDGIASIRADAALKMLLESVSGGFADIDYVVSDGLIKVATKDSLPVEMTTLVYNVIDLLGRPADFSASVSGGGGGGGSEQDVGGGFTDDSDQDEMDRSEMGELSLERAGSLLSLIQETIEPESWFEAGGEGTVTAYGNKKLVILQTLSVHNKIKKLLMEMRKTLGDQVAIEARFLLVGENFLEDIGLDIDIKYDPGEKFKDRIDFSQSSNIATAPDMTGVPGSLAGSAIASSLFGSYGNILLDDLQVDFFLRATQAHRDSKALTAPKVTVMNGESAALRVQKLLLYAGDVEVDTREAGDEAIQSFTVNYETRSVTSGSILNITPTISHDKKNVLLNIVAELRDFLGFSRQLIQLPVVSGGANNSTYGIEFPETEVSRVQTRVSVPDGATLLLGGQKLTAEVEKESGVPILSRIPILGRAFSNRSKVKDHKILLILVKPTIILQEEAEAEAIAEMESEF